MASSASASGPDSSNGAGVRRVLVLASAGKPEAAELLAEIRPWLEERVDEVRVETDPRAFAKTRAQGGPPSGPGPDLLVVLGGDGTLLGAVRAFADDPVPTLGINVGRVGFLASTPVTRWRETLGGVLAGEGVIEPRTRITARWSANGKPKRAVALNDVVLQRGSHQGMLGCALRVGQDWVTNYRADGLIVATASGSTAYSLSAGGPILAPPMEALVVTPICPQGLSNRPIVLDSASELSLTVTRADSITTLVVDGQEYHQLSQGDGVVVTRHPQAYPLYAMPGLDPYRRLRERLGWRGGIEPDVFVAGEPRPPGVDEGSGGVL